MPVPTPTSIESPASGTVFVAGEAIPLVLAESTIPAWSPGDIATLRGWYRTDSGLWQDSGKATAVSADLDPVGAWEPKAGDGTMGDLIQATSGSKPTYRTNRLNGHPSLSFDGGDWLRDAAFASPLAQPNDIYIVVRFTSPGSTLVAFASANANARHSFWQNNADRYRFSAGSTVTGGTVTTGYHYAVVRFDGASSSLRIDGAEDITGDPGSESMDGFTLGAGTTGATELDGDVVEVLVAELTASELTELESYAASRYGL